MAEYLHDNGEITIEMLEELFESDVGHALDGCHKLYPDYDNFTENRQNALCDFVFQVGIGTAKTFKHTNACINSGDWDGAADNLMDSEYAKQVPSRAKEVAQLIREG
jgi:lysozyme